MAEISLTIKSIEDLNRVATIMVNSGFFPDLKTMDQACVKIMAGQEMGIPPVASVRGIYIVRGQVSTSSQIMASLIKRSDRYAYKVVETTSEQCRIKFFEDGEECGESTYSMDDAKIANLLGSDTWKKHPKMMLFNRAMSNGAKMYCPDIFHGSPYVVGELDDPIIDEDGQDIPNMTASKSAGRDEVDGSKHATYSPSEKHLGVLFGELKRLGVRDNHKRKLVEFMHRGTTGITSGQCTQLINILKGENILPYNPFFSSYLSMLLDEHSPDRRLFNKFWHDRFGGIGGMSLTVDQRNELIDWVTSKHEETLPEELAPADTELAHNIADDVYELEASTLEPSPWLATMTRIQNETGESIDQIESWLLKTWGQGSYRAVEDMPVAWIESVSKMSASDIKTSMSGLTLV